MCQKIQGFCKPQRLRVLNFLTYGLMATGLILRFILNSSSEDGIGMTPTFLYIVQFVFSYIFIMLLIMGEMHKPVAILLCFPLLMSRVGRGTIILMVSLPITNFNEAVCAIIAMICSCIGVINMMLGCRDGQVELTYAKDGVPESNTTATSTAAPAASKPATSPY